MGVYTRQLFAVVVGGLLAVGLVSVLGGQFSLASEEVVMAAVGALAIGIGVTTVVNRRFEPGEGE